VPAGHGIDAVPSGQYVEAGHCVTFHVLTESILQYDPIVAVHLPGQIYPFTIHITTPGNKSTHEADPNALQ
jgi:hypothetical protein